MKVGIGLIVLAATISAWPAIVSAEEIVRPKQGGAEDSDKSLFVATASETVSLFFGSSRVQVDRSIVTFPTYFANRTEAKIQYGDSVSIKLPGYSATSKCSSIVAISLAHIVAGPKSSNAFWGRVVRLPQIRTPIPRLYELVPEKPIDRDLRYYVLKNQELRDFNRDSAHLFVNRNKTDLNFQLTQSIRVIIVMPPDPCVLENVEQIALRAVRFLRLAGAVD
jgi:hypothetical protein